MNIAYTVQRAVYELFTILEMKNKQSESGTRGHMALPGEQMRKPNINHVMDCRCDDCTQYNEDQLWQTLWISFWHIIFWLVIAIGAAILIYWLAQSLGHYFTPVIPECQQELRILNNCTCNFSGCTLP
jgi:hypothetical protein